MSDLGDADYRCSLTDVTWKKAQEELKEDASTRVLEVKTLRQRIEKVPGLKANLKFSFLLAFLRARKFEQERAYSLVKNHYETKRNLAQYFDDLKPSRVRHVIEDDLMEVLPNRDNNGCRVLVMRLGRWDPDRYSLNEIIKLVFLVLSKLSEEEETQVHGIHLIHNLTHLTLKHASHYTPSLAKRLLSILQDVLPLRLRRIDYFNEPTFFDVLYTVARPFLTKKLINKLVMNGSKPDKIHETISPDYLPTDLGGKLPMFQGKTFMDNLLTCDAQFEESNKYGFLNMDVSKSNDVSKFGDASVQGLGGTFKKLDVS